MSILIDKLMSKNNPTVEINNRWYIAKDIEYKGFTTLLNRVKDAIRVLFGKSRAYHFKEDEK